MIDGGDDDTDDDNDDDCHDDCGNDGDDTDTKNYDGENEDV